MTTREVIKAEIDRLDDEHLDELHDLVRRFTQSKERGGSFMQKLKRVEIEAPEDFAENLDHYLSGEKHVR